jgi:hypothetical protein
MRLQVVGLFLFPPSVTSLLMKENLGGGALVFALSRLGLYLLHIVLQASVDFRLRCCWVF